MESSKILKQHNTKTIHELALFYNNGALDLSPAFQRQSVWGKNDRQQLIDTVVRNYPLPAIFLYKREVAGEITYSVIDGKQRLETLFSFLGHIRGTSFEVKLEIPGMKGLQTLSGKIIKTKKEYQQLHSNFQNYQIPVIEVSGDLSDIIEIFVRINSTGKPLSGQEKRNAKYSGSSLLREAARIANKYEGYFVELGAISKQQVARMKHVEFIAELIVTMNEGGVINKKAAIDKVMTNEGITSAKLTKACGRVVTALNHVRRMFPELRSTRFKQIGDFYSLVALIDRLAQEGAILTDKKRNRLAWGLLKAFSNEVDALSTARKNLEAGKNQDSIYREYLLTVLHGTDAVGQRRKREEILEGIIASVFAQKDAQRGFTPEQRRIIWNTSAERKCTYPGCRTKLDWNTFTIDHIDPHSKGGRSTLDNAALMCRVHNSAKGNSRMSRSSQQQG
ncbi:MAG TPA: DUF262 domain-containing protein [Noviherbaspirillum sp.]|nr:DUF262 domain-containing protein [Noviherbaspirillum sp.]